jgi:hypothetical protein
LPFAGSQEAADASPDGADDEHAASTPILAAAATTAPARRMRVAVLLICSFQRTTSDGARRVDVDASGRGFRDTIWLGWAGRKGVGSSAERCGGN